MNTTALPPSKVEAVVAVGGRRPNFAWFSADRAVIGDIVTDASYMFRPADTEVSKLLEQSNAIKKLLGDAVRIFFVRLHGTPDGTPDSDQHERNAAYGQCLRQFMEADVSTYDASVPHVKHLFYHPAMSRQLGARTDIHVLA
jgi:hypothetical protein